MTGMRLHFIVKYTRYVTFESFRVIRPNLLEVSAGTDPDLPGLVIFYDCQTEKRKIQRNYADH